jgi:hypothetical protein
LVIFVISGVSATFATPEITGKSKELKPLRHGQRLGKQEGQDLARKPDPICACVEFITWLLVKLFYHSEFTKPVANKGTSGEIVGKSPDGVWWAVKLPADVAPEGHGWVHGRMSKRQTPRTCR